MVEKFLTNPGCEAVGLSMLGKTAEVCVDKVPLIMQTCCTGCSGCYAGDGGSLYSPVHAHYMLECMSHSATAHTSLF